MTGLRDFLSKKKGSRYDLTRTWVRYGHEWASDGQVAVGLPTQKPHTTGRAVPDPSELLVISLLGHWEPWPMNPPDGDKVWCDVCRNPLTGRHRTTCPYCHRTRGGIQAHEATTVIVAKRNISPWNHGRIIALPGPVTVHVPPVRDDSIVFRFGEVGIGAVMVAL